MYIIMFINQGFPTTLPTTVLWSVILIVYCVSSMISAAPDMSFYGVEPHRRDSYPKHDMADPAAAPIDDEQPPLLPSQINIYNASHLLNHTINDTNAQSDHDHHHHQGEEEKLDNIDNDIINHEFDVPDYLDQQKCKMDPKNNNDIQTDPAKDEEAHKILGATAGSHNIMSNGYHQDSQEDMLGGSAPPDAVVKTLQYYWNRGGLPSVNIHNSNVSFNVYFVQSKTSNEDVAENPTDEANDVEDEDKNEEAGNEVEDENDVEDENKNDSLQEGDKNEVEVVEDEYGSLQEVDKNQVKDEHQNEFQDKNEAKSEEAFGKVRIN